MQCLALYCQLFIILFSPLLWRWLRLLLHKQIKIMWLEIWNSLASLLQTKLPYLPTYRPHFFQGKNVRNLGCGLDAGTRVLSSLICKISRHTHSQQIYWMPDSLIECIMWGQVNPCLRRILLLSAAMSVSSFWICLSLDEVQRSLHVKPRSPFHAVHMKPRLFICQTTRKMHRTHHKKKKS